MKHDQSGNETKFYSILDIISLQ